MSLPTIAIYARVSTEEQIKDGTSFKNQPSQVMAHLDKLFGKGKYLYEIFEDEGKSGALGPRPWATARKARERKGLWEMLQRLKAGEFTHVAATRIDRLYRDKLGFLGLYKEVIQPKGIKLVLAFETFDDTLAGRLAQGMVSEFAEFMREQISENIKANLDSRRKEGYYQGTIPFGWRKEEPHEYAGRRPNIQPVPEEGEVVKRIVEMYLSGRSELAIARILNAENVSHKRSTGNWRQNTVNLVLTCPLHAGLVRDGDGNLIPGLHFENRYYDERTLSQIMARIERNRTRLKGVSHTQPHRLFSGIAVCGHCGKRLQGSFHTDHPGYRCLGRVQSFDGSHVYISAKKLEQLVVAQLASLAREPEVLVAIESEIDSLVRGQDDALTKRAKEISSALQNLVTQEDKVIEGHVKRLFTEDVIKRKLKQIEEDRLTLNTELVQIDKALSQRATRSALIRNAKAALPKFDAIWDRMEDHEQREALHLSIRELKVFATDERKWIELNLVFKEEPIVIEVLRGAERYRTGKLDGPGSLTPRELAALKHAGDGANYVQIAKYFDSTPTNAHALLRRAMQKLNAKSVPDAVAMAAPTIRRLQSQLPLYGRVEAPKHSPKRLKVMEYQILNLSAEGKGVKEISLQSGISVERVSLMLESALTKLSVKGAVAGINKLSKDDSLIPVTMSNRRRRG
jgi:DNA invertase Pin-like site-specific DNA recombinase/DNA-binding CsgD family transcriptional regulator